MKIIGNVLRIAHISDVHLCSRFKKKNISKLNSLIKHALENGVQHFVFTGDISDNAAEKDFILFRQILKRHDLLRSDKSSIIIGNHDIYGAPQTAQDVINFPSKCMRINYEERLMHFVSHFRELFEDIIQPDICSFFPFAKEFKDVLMVGANSIDAYSRFRNPFASNGHVSKSHRKLIDSILSTPKYKDKLKIVLIHHHFYKSDHDVKSSEPTMWNRIENYTMKLRGKKKLFKMFVGKNVKIVLHGHSHEMNEYYRKGIRFINAGGSMEGDEARMYIVDAFPFDIEASLVTVPIKPIKENRDESIIAMAV